MDIRSEIMAACQGEGKNIHLAKVKKFIRDNHEIFKDVIDLAEVDKLPTAQKRKYIFDRICHVLKVMPKKSPTPKKTPTPRKKLEILVRPASKGYLRDLKREIDAYEQDNYSITSFKKDIKSDAFVEKAVTAHEVALRYKVEAYKKLAKYKWNMGEESGGPKDNININMNKVIQDILDKITKDLNKYTSTSRSYRIESKRKQLESIVDDIDNGIVTIKGKSRANVRTMLIKIVYMFLRVPNFFFKSFINFMVTGPAGSGKTKVAAVIAHIFQTLGILATDNVVMTTRQNFIGQYVGQSAPKTQKLLSASLEGVVFIDEAYTLTPCPDDHVSGNGANEAFAREAVGELINFMDKFSGCFVIIAAGYKDKMYNCFLTFNEGMARRFPKVVDFIPYQNEDMNEIFLHFVDDSIDISLFSKAQLAFFQEMIFALNEQEVFNNQAGDMLNLAKMVAEDAMLAGDDYDKPRMILTLKKFCAMKNVAISM